MQPKPLAYLTTFCNFPHRVKDGKPIGHGCYILRPESLRLEMEDKCDQIEKMHDGIIHPGLRR